MAVIDISMPILSGMEVVLQLAHSNLETKVLALTVNEDRTYVQRMLALGALGYMLKRSAADELIRAIRCIGQGVRYLDTTVLNLVHGMQNPLRSEVRMPEGCLNERNCYVDPGRSPGVRSGRPVEKEGERVRLRREVGYDVSAERANGSGRDVASMPISVNP